MAAMGLCFMLGCCHDTCLTICSGSLGCFDECDEVGALVAQPKEAVSPEGLTSTCNSTMCLERRSKSIGSSCFTIVLRNKPHCC